MEIIYFGLLLFIACLAGSLAFDKLKGKLPTSLPKFKSKSKPAPKQNITFTSSVPQEELDQFRKLLDQKMQNYRPGTFNAAGLKTQVMTVKELINLIEKHKGRQR